MSTPRSMSLLRHGSILAAALVLAASVAHAQFAHVAATSDDAIPAPVESSSSSGLPDGIASSAEPAASGHGQSDRSSAYGRHNYWSHLTYEAGGGFNAPTNDSSPYITWGGNLTVGAGYRFDPHIGLLAEYQFIDSKLPGAFIAETGANGGYAHIWSFTLAPVIDLFPKSSNSLYVTGGGGFYRKVTSFTDPELAEYCTYYYCAVGTINEVVGHFSSNQGGWNVGLGYAHRVGGVYGDSKMKLFAEARYLDVMTPAITTQPNGLGTTTVAADTKIIPVTLGVRW
jgi:hypothetical protein